MLSIATDYVSDAGDVEPALKAISEAGFTHIHWCHHWANDFVYDPVEVEQIQAWLKQYGLKLLDLHASAGHEKNWDSVHESRREAGVALVKNRLEMTARLGGAVIVMHSPVNAREDKAKEVSLEAVYRSLDELEREARMLGVRIAMENLYYASRGNLERLEDLCARYSPEFLGLCFDSGHAHMIEGMLDGVERLRERVIAVHLHDNGGMFDEHLLPYRGSVDWARVAKLVAGSGYGGCVSLEVSQKNHPAERKDKFLADAHAAGKKLAAELGHARSAAHRHMG